MLTLSRVTWRLPFQYLLHHILFYTICLLFVSCRLRRSLWGGTDRAESNFRFCQTRVGCGPASEPTLKNALYRTCLAVGRRTNKHRGLGKGTTLFPGFLHFTLDPYLIMLSVKQGGIKYHFWVLGMTLPGIETRSRVTLANTLTLMQMAL